MSLHATSYSSTATGSNGTGSAPKKHKSLSQEDTATVLNLQYDSALQSIVKHEVWEGH